MDFSQSAGYILLYVGSVTLAALASGMLAFKLGQLHSRASKVKIHAQYQDKLAANKARIKQLETDLAQYRQMQRLARTATNAVPGLAKQASGAWAAIRGK